MSSEGAEFLETAAEIASRIADSGVWYEGRCNWIGVLGRDGSVRSAGSGSAALGPDLYGGTSGVALFLAEAGAMLNDGRIAATALGAALHALQHADQIDDGQRDGFYGGWIGVAYAAIRIASVLDAEDVAEHARDLVLRWRDDCTRSAASDVMTGRAGAVLGLLAIRDELDEPWLVDSAIGVGEGLLDKAQITNDGWSWRAPGPRGMHNLCGYAHGVAGIAHGLLELFALSGDPRFREGAEHGFEYERSWIDSQSGTWPDLRSVARRAGRDLPLPSSDSWCNGATGIAASRLRATELVETELVRSDAERAVTACERHARRLLEQEPDDFSLCHGAAGTADVLLRAANGSNDSLAELAAEVGRWGVEHRPRRPGSGFACGLPDGETPGLLLGLAGMGMFYLRLCDPEVGTPLLVHRQPG